MVARGLNRSYRVTSDEHASLVEAIGAYLPRVSWQILNVHTVSARSLAGQNDE